MHALRTRGMGLIDVVVGIALLLIVFGALFGLLRVSVSLATLAKSKATALEIANTQMEQLRALSYGALGTAGGSPSGAIPAHRVVTENQGTYTIDTTISYYDNPADGVGPGDSNGIPNDYKIGSVRVTYLANGQPSTVELVSNFAPLGIETAP